MNYDVGIFGKMQAHIAMPYPGGGVGGFEPPVYIRNVCPTRKNVTKMDINKFCMRFLCNPSPRILLKSKTLSEKQSWVWPCHIAYHSHHSFSENGCLPATRRGYEL
jgi:hypothetical protein